MILCVWCWGRGLCVWPDRGGVPWHLVCDWGSRCMSLVLEAGKSGGRHWWQLVNAPFHIGLEYVDSDHLTVKTTLFIKNQNLFDNRCPRKGMGKCWHHHAVCNALCGTAHAHIPVLWLLQGQEELHQELRCCNIQVLHNSQKVYLMFVWYTLRKKIKPLNTQLYLTDVQSVAYSFPAFTMATRGTRPMYPFRIYHDRIIVSSTCLVLLLLCFTSHIK